MFTLDFCTNLHLIKFVVIWCMVFVCVAILQMSQWFSRGKAPVIDLTSSPVSKRTQQALVTFDRRRFKTLLDFQSYNNLFKNASILVERL